MSYFRVPHPSCEAWLKHSPLHFHIIFIFMVHFFMTWGMDLTATLPTIHASHGIMVHHMVTSNQSLDFNWWIVRGLVNMWSIWHEYNFNQSEIQLLLSKQGEWLFWMIWRFMIIYLFIYFCKLNKVCIIDKIIRGAYTRTAKLTEEKETRKPGESKRKRKQRSPQLGPSKQRNNSCL